MKKIALFFVLLLAFQPIGFSAFDDVLEGSTNLSDLDVELTDNLGDLEDTLEDMRGWVNLQVVRTDTETVTVTADELWLQQSGDLARNFSTVSEAIDITASGAGGLDTGSEASSTWYYIWVIAKDDNTIDGLLSASSSAPTLPSGYTFKALVSAVFNDSGSDFVDFKDTGRYWYYSSWENSASGNVGAGSWTSIDITNYVPSVLSNQVFGELNCGSNGGGVFITNDNSTASGSTIAPNKIGQNSGGTNMFYWEFNVLTANTLYWLSDHADAAVYIAGFIKNKLT